MLVSVRVSKNDHPSGFPSILSRLCHTIFTNHLLTFLWDDLRTGLVENGGRMDHTHHHNQKKNKNNNKNKNKNKTKNNNNNNNNNKKEKEATKKGLTKGNWKLIKPLE